MNNFIKPINTMFFAALIGGMMIGTSGGAFADGHAKINTAGEIDYRQSVMKSVGGHMAAMKAIIQGKTANRDQFLIHAQGMLALAKVSQKVYPKGTGPEAGKTRALPEIWTEWEKFKKISDGFVTESEKLVKLAEAGDMKGVAGQFGNLGKNACSACHKPYRAKKKE